MGRWTTVAPCVHQKRLGCIAAAAAAFVCAVITPRMDGLGLGVISTYWPGCFCKPSCLAVLFPPPPGFQLASGLTVSAASNPVEPGCCLDEPHHSRPRSNKHQPTLPQNYTHMQATQRWTPHLALRDFVGRTHDSSSPLPANQEAVAKFPGNTGLLGSWSSLPFLAGPGPFDSLHPSHGQRLPLKPPVDDCLAPPVA